MQHFLDRLSRIIVLAFLVMVKGFPVLSAPGWYPVPDRPASEYTLLTSLFFLDSQYGWAAGSGVVMRTEDGGFHWEEVLVGEVGQTMGLCFTDRLNGWATGYDISPTGRGYVLRTTDGGKTWTKRTIEEIGDINGIWFNNLSTGWIVGQGARRTVDGGTTWEGVGISVSGSFYINDVAFVDQDHGWMAGHHFYMDPEGSEKHRGFVLRSPDAGTSWVTTYIDINESYLHAVHFGSPLVGCAVGWTEMLPSRTPQALLVHTTDGGVTWTPRSVDAVRLWDVHYGDSLNVWAVGSRAVQVGGSTAYRAAILHSLDGGEHWTEQSVPEPLNSAMAVWFQDPDTGWLAARDSIGSLILKTFTGGEPASATSVRFFVNPTNTQAGTALEPAPVAGAADEKGRRILDFTGPVSVSLLEGTGKPDANLFGTRSVETDYGLASFPRLAIDTVGTGYQLVASAEGLQTGTSEPFDITRPVVGDVDANDVIDILDAVKILRVAAGLDFLPARPYRETE